MGVSKYPPNGTSCPFGILPASCWTLLGVRLHPTNPVEDKPSPNAVALAPPPILVNQWKVKALAFLGSVWQFGEMSNLQKPTLELLAELKKQDLAFTAGIRACAQLREADDPANDPAWWEAWEKTKAANVAYEAAAAQIPDNLPSSS